MHISKYACCFDIDDRHSLLLSSLTGAADVLDVKNRKMWLDLTTHPGNPENKEFISALQERGYIFPSEEDEATLCKELEIAFHKARKNEVLRLAICPTFQCNLACKYCYEGQLPQTSVTTLNEEDVLHLFEEFTEVFGGRNQKVSIELTGGEPLLPKNNAVIERVFIESVRKGYHVGIVSNGVCLASHYSDIFLRYAKYVSFVQVTLDGPPDIHNQRRVFRDGKGTFEYIASSIDFLVEHRIPTRLRVNIDSSNVSYLPELAEIIIKRDWLKNSTLECDVAPVLDHRGESKYPYLIPEPELMKKVWELKLNNLEMQKVFRFRLFRSLQHISSVIEESKGFPSPCVQYCEANSPNFFVFGPDGYIYACGESIGNPDFAIGRFLPDYCIWPDKEKLWRGRSITSIPACKNCNIAGFCGGGCTYSALIRYGKPDVEICNNAVELLQNYCRTLAQSSVAIND